MSVGSFEAIPSEAKPSALPLIPPTLFISVPPNFSLLSSRLSLSPRLLCLCVCTTVSYLPSLPLFLQVLVAFISFSETMLLVYLSYKVSHLWPSTDTLKPFVKSEALMSTGSVGNIWMDLICMNVSFSFLSSCLLFQFERPSSLLAWFCNISEQL